MVELGTSQENDTADALRADALRAILSGTVAKRQAILATEILTALRSAGCYSRSGKQMFASDLKVEGPRATVYRVVSALEKAGLIDRESRYSGYFLSHNFSNKLEEKAETWRKFCKGP